MSTLKTFTFWLEPDEQFAMFKRLAWKLVDVFIGDVLMGGVHPWTTNQDGTDVHPSLIDAFLQRLNDEAAKVAELESFGYGHDVPAQHGHYYEKKTRFERTLEYVQKNVRFVDDLSYLRLLEMAKRRLWDSWNHRVARTLAERGPSGLPGAAPVLEGQGQDGQVVRLRRHRPVRPGPGAYARRLRRPG